MKRLGWWLLCAAVAGTMSLSAQGPKTHLKVGDMAPDFELRSSQGGTVKLSSFKGKNSVVLAFFPAAFTGG